MLPKEITDIVLKYQSKMDEVSTINAAIEELIYQLNSINSNIAEKLTTLINSVDASDEEDQILNDSKVLRKYIATIKKIQYNNDIIMYSERVNLYLYNDDICPECGWKLEENDIQYEIVNSKEKQIKNITVHKCPVCNKLFVFNTEICKVDLDVSNIIVHNNYYRPEELHFQDVIVLSTVANCITRGHNVIDRNVNIPTIEKNGNIKFIRRNIAYCNECNKYIMLKSDFNEVDNIIACQVIDQTVTQASEKDEIEISQKQSILYQYGYNVKTKDNLSDKQRHLILALIVEAGILSRVQISSHLDTLIERGGKIPKWEEATNKWKQDRYYISKYKPEKLPSVVTNKLILKYRK